MAFALFVLAILFYSFANTSIQTKNTFSYLNNDTYWQSLSEFTPIVNATYGRIKLGRTVEMHYKFIYHSRSAPLTDNKTYENAFRIGYSAGWSDASNGGDGAGSRYPAMWVRNDLPTGPNIRFSVSDHTNNYKQIGTNYPINQEQTYIVFIQFNQTNAFIHMSTESESDIIIRETRKGTLNEYLDTYLSVMISQHGHNKVTPAANMTLFDMVIQMNEHIIPLVSNESIELYEFYNEELFAEYQNKIELYASFVENAILMALSELTNHSMNINDYALYVGEEWSYGGIHTMEHCVVLNDKIVGLAEERFIDCPAIPRASNSDFEYVSVVLLYTESDMNIDAFDEYITDVLNMDKFADLFREYLRMYVNEDQSLFVMPKQEKKDTNVLLTGGIIGICAIVLCFAMIGHINAKEIALQSNETDIGYRKLNS